MQAKLTLTMEKVVIQNAKKYARQQGSSLSALVENFLKMVTREDKQGKHEITPRIRELRGSFKAPEGFDYRKELSKALTSKHL